MNIFSKIFGSKKIDEERTENNEAFSQEPLVFDDQATQVVEFKNTPNIGNPPKIDNNPETLPEAIRYVVGKWGKDYLLDRGFINVLNDFKVLKDIPAAKHVLMNMQNSGYISKMLLSTNWEIDAPSFALKFAKDYGTRNELVTYVVQSIGYGLKYLSKKPHFQDEEANTVVINPNSKGYTATMIESEDFEPYDPKRDLEDYHYPTLYLLKKYDDYDIFKFNIEEQTARKEHIVDLLRKFGIEITAIKTYVGPTITLHEITLAPGVLISKVRKIEDDFCILLNTSGARIVAPIPGKGTIGIEVPNTEPSMLFMSMESTLNSKKFQESQMDLPCAIGKSVFGEVFMFDLAKAPHLLVAGAMGQGKSVCINTILTSLLYKKHPAELKFVLIDPKKVELSIYSPLVNHFLASVPDYDDNPIISDETSVIHTLTSLNKLMDARYDLLKKARTRNIKDYNQKFVARQLNPNYGHKFLSYIVVIIDEYGDLMMRAGKEIEMSLIRLAQLAHTVGIHMIITTRHLSARIITDSIKTNFLSRIAFRVFSASESKIILDRTGAHQLIGRGDMLYQNYGNEPIRVQCAFVDTQEVERMCEYISDQQSYKMPYELPDPDEPVYDYRVNEKDVDMTHLDPLFEDAARLIVFNQSASTSTIQRKFAIGYNRAGRLMDQLEKAGVVGAAYGSKPRDVLIHDESSLNNLLNKLRT